MMKLIQPQSCLPTSLRPLGRLSLMALYLCSYGLSTPHSQAEIDLANLDLSVKPADNFYEYANGGWLKKAVIPDDKAAWGTFEELDERSKAQQKALCAEAMKAATPTAVEKMVGDFYASGMDQAAIDQAGLTPLRPELDKIAALKDISELPPLAARFHRLGAGVLFGIGSEPDPKNSTMVITGLGQGGLGLPDRDYYFNDDDSSKDIRQAYLAHVAKMLQLSGDTPEAAKSAAEGIMRLETSLAEGSRKRTELRDPVKNYNRLTEADLQAKMPHWSWRAYFTALKLDKPGDLDVGQPDYFVTLEKQLASTPLSVWKDYLRWHLISDAASSLSKAFDNEAFSFYGTKLTGAQSQSERWKRVLKQLDGAIGEQLGQLYVAKHFPQEAKDKMLKLVANLNLAMKKRLQKLEWMDEPTRAKALEKLAAFSVKIGFPDQWRDYKGLVIDRGPYVLNVMRAHEFTFQRDLEKIGKPVDRNEWHMSPPTVNAYYNPQLNEIVFPAGILQPPFFDFKADDALNYGGIGAVIGHEISHGFDDQGRQFDAKGNLSDWWTPECAKRFTERTKGIVVQFSGYKVIDDLKINGELTQGENIADLAGLKIAYAALQQSLRDSPGQGKIDGFSPAQRFFLSWATGWRKAMRPEKLRLMVRVDPHSPARFRVNGPFANLEEFFDAFDIPEGAPMRRDAKDRVTIW